eukprot:1157373-Lingulodinium_polyedra.AAC.1
MLHVLHFIQFEQQLCGLHCTQFEKQLRLALSCFASIDAVAMADCTTCIAAQRSVIEFAGVRCHCADVLCCLRGLAS